jgi:hypothetical protein
MPISFTGFSGLAILAMVLILTVMQLLKKESERN